ncbi:hypothetical protein ACX1C1_05370 [Paenibacillus sp. strain BS8-2]
MNKTWAKVGVVMLASSTLLLQNPIFPSNSQNVYAAAAVGVSNQVIKLNAQNTLTITDAQLLMQDQGRVLAFAIEINNKGKTPLSLNDYWMKLKNKSGQSFSVKLIDGDKTKKSVAGSSTQTLTYYAVVDNASKLSDFVFEAIAWDFSASNYERKLGSIQYPQGSTNVTNVGAIDNFTYSTSKLAGKASDHVLTEDQNYEYLTMNYTIENKGMSVADLSGLNLFLQSSDNKSYSVNTEGLKEIKLRAGEKKTVTIRSMLPKQVKGKSLVLVAASYDDSSKLYIPLSAINLGAFNQGKTVAAGTASVLAMNGQRVNTFIDATFISGVSEKKELSLEYALRNVGTEAVSGPSLTFYLMTSDNTLYPLTTSKSLNDVTLLPNLREVISVTGMIPATVDTETAKLVIKSADAATKSEYVVAVHNLNVSSQNATMGTAYTYNNYSIKLNSIQSSTSESNDLLVADLTVTNKGKESSSIPELSGYFLLNGVKLNVETKKVALENKLILDSQDSSQFVVYAKVPNTVNMKTISFVLTEKGSESTSTEKTITKFTTDKLSSVQTLTPDKTYEVLEPGKRTSAKLNKANIFTGENGRYFYSEFELTNKEARSAVLSSLGGYVKDVNGETSFLNFSNYEKRILSNGKVLLSAWSELSESFDETDFDFIVGRSMNVAAGEAGQAAETLIIKPINYALDIDQVVEPQTNLTNIPFAGYDLSMRNVYATFSVLGPNEVNGIKLTFNYDLEKDKRYTAVATDNKIMLEFVDQGSGKVAYTKVLSLGTGESNETILKEALNGSSSIVFEDPDFQVKIQKYEDYVLNVYDVFQDARILVATKPLKWFMTQ